MNIGPAVNNNPEMRAKFDAQDSALVGAQADAFERGNPTARVIRIPHARHFIFQSNEADVLREIVGFVARLP